MNVSGALSKSRCCIFSMFSFIFASYFLVFNLSNFHHFLDSTFPIHGFANAAEVFSNATLPDSFAIRTPGCQIPDMDPFDPSVAEYISSMPPYICSAVTWDQLTYVQNGTLYVNTEILGRMHIRLTDVDSAARFNCCAWFMFRNPVEESDEFMRYPENCVSFQKSISIPSEYLKVECYLDQQRIYQTYHHNFMRKPEVEARVKSFNDSCADRLSVIMVVIDSVSRVNFRRQFTESRKVLLEELGAIELNGYNRVGDNTFPNLIPLLKGEPYTQLKSTCWRDERDPFDNCTFLWNDFSSGGYRTAFVEDVPSIGVFHFEKPGFRRLPTDYYTHSYFREFHPISFLQSDCLNGISEPELVLKMAHDYMSLFRGDPIFGIFSTSRFTHEDLNQAKFLDPMLKKYLRIFKYDKLLENTVLVVASDHGLRFGKFRRTPAGCREVNLPTFYLVLPPGFCQKHPVACEKLRENANRLTTPYDVHRTLIDITGCNFDGSTNVFQDGDLRIQAKSLFGFIPETRVCQEAGIAPEYCSCQETGHVIADRSPIIDRALNALMTNLNAMTLPHRNICAEFSLSRMERTNEIQRKNENGVLEKYYEIVFVTSPGECLFQGTVAESSVSNNVSHTPNSEISRINMYGNSSACISGNSILRQFCFCV